MQPYSSQQTIDLINLYVYQTRHQAKKLLIEDPEPTILPCDSYIAMYVQSTNQAFSYLSNQ